MMKLNLMMDKIFYIKPGKYIFIPFIGATLKKFRKTNPPCNDCLVQTMCISETSYNVAIKYCDELYKFIDNSDLFACKGWNGWSRGGIQ